MTNLTNDFKKLDELLHLARTSPFYTDCKDIFELFEIKNKDASYEDIESQIDEFVAKASGSEGIKFEIIASRIDKYEQTLKEVLKDHRKEYDEYLQENDPKIKELKIHFEAYTKYDKPPTLDSEEKKNLIKEAIEKGLRETKALELIKQWVNEGGVIETESHSSTSTSSAIPFAYYEILGVSEDATDEQIENAYNTKYQEVKIECKNKKKSDALWPPIYTAYKCLKDSRKRRKYDEEQKRKRDKDLTDDGGPKLEIEDESGNERRNYGFKDMRLGTAQSVTVIAKNGGGGTLDAKIKTSHPWLIVDTNKIHQSKLPQEITITVDPKKNPKKNTFGGKDTGHVDIAYKNGTYTINVAYKMVEDVVDLKRFRRSLTIGCLIFGFFFGLVISNLIEGIEQNGFIIIAAFIGTISVSSIWGYKDAGGGGAIGWGIGTAVGVFILFAILTAWFPHDALLTVVWALIYGSVANILSDFIRRAIRQGNYQVPIGSGIGIIALTAMLIFIGTEGAKRFFNNPKKTYTVPQKSTDESERTIKLGDKIYNKSDLGFTTKLGCDTRFITTQLQKSYGLRDNLGALAYDIKPNSPAAKTGIKSGDVIIKYNGNKIKDPLHLNRLITKTEIYKGEEIVIIRDGKKLTLNTTIIKLPKTSNERVIKNTELGRKKKVNSTFNSNSLFASSDSRIYHKPNCPKLNTEDLVEFTSSQKAQDAGGIPCEHCNPSTYAGKHAIKVGSSNIFSLTSHVQDSDKFDIHYRVYPSSFQEIWYVVNQQLNQQKEKSIQQNKGKGIIITDLTRHGIYGFPHYDKYYIVIEKLDRFSTKVNLKLFSYYTDIVLLPDNKTFVNKRARKFLSKITKALAKNY